MPGGGVLPRGRPDAEVQRQRYRLQRLLRHATTDDDVLEVWDHVTDMAKTSGDIQWASLFLAYTLGKPTSVDGSSTGGIQIDGDLQINLQKLSLEEIRAAQAAIQTIDATFAPVDRSPDAPALAHPHSG
jgi:hypothetical protein